MRCVKEWFQEEGNKLRTSIATIRIGTGINSLLMRVCEQHSYAMLLHQATKLETLKIGYREDVLNSFLQNHLHFEIIIMARRLMNQKRFITDNIPSSATNLANMKQTIATYLKNIGCVTVFVRFFFVTLN